MVLHCGLAGRQGGLQKSLQLQHRAPEGPLSAPHSTRGPGGVCPLRRHYTERHRKVPRALWKKQDYSYAVPQLPVQLPPGRGLGRPRGPIDRNTARKSRAVVRDQPARVVDQSTVPWDARSVAELWRNTRSGSSWACGARWAKMRRPAGTPAEGRDARRGCPFMLNSDCDLLWSSWCLPAVPQKADVRTAAAGLRGGLRAGRCLLCARAGEAEGPCTPCPKLREQRWHPLWAGVGSRAVSGGKVSEDPALQALAPASQPPSVILLGLLSACAPHRSPPGGLCLCVERTQACVHPQLCPFKEYGEAGKLLASSSCEMGRPREAAWHPA